MAAVTTPGTAGPSNVYVTLAYLVSQSREIHHEREQKTHLTVKVELNVAPSATLLFVRPFLVIVPSGLSRNNLRPSGSLEYELGGLSGSKSFSNFEAGVDALNAMKYGLQCEPEPCARG